jgi:hypothetical protein
VQEKNGVLLHFCVECGRFGSHGRGVQLRAGRLGRWYCREHRPQTPAKESSEQKAENADPAEILAELAALKQIQKVVEVMTLEQVQGELRAISGTPLRDETDGLRRRALWRRLDAPCASSSSNNKLASDADQIGEASSSVVLDR